MDIDVLLSDEFVAFSRRIEAIHKAKRDKKQQLRAFYEKIQEEMKALDDEARETLDEFDAWKQSRRNQVEVCNVPEPEPMPVSEK